MINKLILSLALVIAGVSYAQQYSTSPFSTSGLGEAGGLEDPQFGGIGNCRAGIMDSVTVNVFNPASYSALSKGQPLFAIGVSSRFSTYTQDDQSSQGRVAGLNQITMAIPFAKRFGFAIGLQPFSRKGYSIVQQEPLTLNGQTDTMQYTYIGSGSTQQVFGGLSWRFIDMKRHKVSIGGNYSFVFGSVTNERRSELMENSPAGGVDFTTYRLGGASYTIGLNYTALLTPKGNQQLSLGFVLTPQQRLNAHRDYTLVTTGNVTTPTTVNSTDTITYINDDKGHIIYPASTTVGFNYSFQPKGGEGYNLKSIYQVNVYGDFTSTLWQNYGTTFSQGHESTNLTNTQRFSFGVQYTPSIEPTKTAGMNYLKRIRYRAGSYFGSLPQSENGTQLSEYAVTFGFGLPISSQRTNSSFNFSFQYGKRGNNEPSGLQETFYGINFGVILAPANYDKWFKRYKLD